MKRYYNIIAQYYGELPTVQVNSDYDAAFADAIREFQRNYDLDPDGVIGALTWTRIVEIVNFINNMRQREESVTASATVSENKYEPYPGITLRRGANGRHVKYIQNALNVINRYKGKKQYIQISGEFDSGTELAVMEYQKSRGLARSGAVDRELWNEMLSEASSLGDMLT